MNEKELLKNIQKLDADKIKFAVTDIDGILRGKTVSKKKFLKFIEEGAGFCNVIFGWDSNDAVYDNSTISGWHTGYNDAIASIDLSTFRAIPWEENVPFFIADFRNSSIADVCPRTLLKKIQQQCIDLGYVPNFAKEYEWFNFKETPETLHAMLLFCFQFPS